MMWVWERWRWQSVRVCARAFLVNMGGFVLSSWGVDGNHSVGLLTARSSLEFD
jgi:hypothetical protein